LFVAEVSLAYIEKRDVSINPLQVGELENFVDELLVPVCSVQVIAGQQ
jgi:hypothetical protein